MSVIFSTGFSVNIDPPQYGYTTDVVMNLHPVESADGKTLIWDDGRAYDYRVCTCEFILDKSDTQNLREALESVSKMRDRNCTMQVQSVDDFFPFGPDQSNNATFDIRILEFADSSTQFTPWQWFRTRVRMLARSLPAYTPAAQFKEGGFFIGTVSDLRYPQDPFELSFNRGIVNQLTRGGTTITVDRTAETDAYFNTFGLELNEGNMAALVEYLQTIRGSAFQIDNDESLYPFGVNFDEGNATAINVKNRENIISVRHDRFSRWAIDLNFTLDSVV